MFVGVGIWLSVGGEIILSLFEVHLVHVFWEWIWRNTETLVRSKLMVFHFTQLVTLAVREKASPPRKFYKTLALTRILCSYVVGCFCSLVILALLSLPFALWIFTGLALDINSPWSNSKGFVTLSFAWPLYYLSLLMRPKKKTFLWAIMSSCWLVGRSVPLLSKYLLCIR